VEVRDFDLEQVLKEPVDTGCMQKVLYAIESFEQIYEATKNAESRLG
jgi:phenylalanine-4-hydroxylase